MTERHDREPGGSGSAPHRPDGHSSSQTHSSPGTPPPTSAAQEGEKVERDLEQLSKVERERDEYLELAKRTQADFENYRKRVKKEAAEAAASGRAQLARELIPVADNLERALDATGDDSELAAGVRLVYEDLVSALKRAGVESYEPQGERFDPELHEAMMTQPVEPKDDGKVVNVMEKGYRLNGQVLRPARVAVGKAE